MSEEKIQRLSEGYDFIEEACGYPEPLSFEEVNEADANEADANISESEEKKSVKSPFHIIGKLVGKFAPVGGFSRNNRYYPESHWRTVLESEEVQRRLKGREMMGMIGHEDSRVGDFQIRNGLVSHVVGCLDIREDANGKPYLYGELDILDTPAGRILKAMHEGGAGLYVSSRGAGKLLDTPGKPYKTVSPQFFLECFDVVARPGFIEAKPVFERVQESEDEKVHESKEEPKQEPANLTEPAVQPQQTSEELQSLKSQLSKLTKIIEKVVDDVYEIEEQPTKEQIEEQLGDLLNNSSVTDEAYEDVVAILQNAKPELLNKIMENSRGRFNDEHAEKSGLKIDYYRFGGNKPYKIVPKDKSYFEASWDSPRYRTLKQAQKHVLDSYNKPKETNEALGEAVSLLIDSNLSKTVLEDIIDTLIKAKKQQ